MQENCRKKFSKHAICHRQRLCKKQQVLFLEPCISLGKSKRWRYIKALKKALGDDLDIWGGCGEKGRERLCKGHYKADCPEINSYKFYLAFENTECTEYMTEKMWWNAYAKVCFI